jgi:protoporphyrinogen oxidase
VNVRADEASLALAAKVFKTGLLEESDAADLGWARVPLSKLHGEAAAAVLARSGSAVHRRAKVSEILTGDVDGHASGVVVDGEVVEADAVVLAVPHDAAAALLPKGVSVVAGDLVELGRSPIVDIHLVYDRRVIEHPVVAAVDSPVQFVFDTTESSGLDPAEGQCVAVSISGADDEHGDRSASLIDRYTAAVAELFPAARQARVLDAVVTREHAATFRGVPGTRRLRPRPESGVAGLHLAGSWTDTGWPATMEGAVRSGVAASAAALRGLAMGVPRGARSDEIGEEVVA